MAITDTPDRCVKCRGKLPYTGGLIPIVACECGHCACESCIEFRLDPESAQKNRVMGGIIAPPVKRTD